MSLAADEGLAIFSDLSVTPKKSFFSEYSRPISPRQTQRLPVAGPRALPGDPLFGRIQHRD